MTLHQWQSPYQLVLGEKHFIDECLAALLSTYVHPFVLRLIGAGAKQPSLSALEQEFALWSKKVLPGAKKSAPGSNYAEHFCGALLLIHTNSRASGQSQSPCRLRPLLQCHCHHQKVITIDTPRCLLLLLLLTPPPATLPLQPATAAPHHCRHCWCHHHHQDVHQ